MFPVCRRRLRLSFQRHDEVCPFNDFLLVQASCPRLTPISSPTVIPAPYCHPRESGDLDSPISTRTSCNRYTSNIIMLFFVSFVLFVVKKICVHRRNLRFKKTKNALRPLRSISSIYWWHGRLAHVSISFGYIPSVRTLNSFSSNIRYAERASCPNLLSHHRDLTRNLNSY